MFAYQKMANQSKFIVLNGTIWYYSFKCITVCAVPAVNGGWHTLFTYLAYFAALPAADILYFQWFLRIHNLPMRLLDRPLAEWILE